MQIIKFILGPIVILAMAGLVLAHGKREAAAIGLRPPDLPPGCERLEITDGSELIFHAFAIGVQIYRWNGAAWDFVAPQANLYADEGYHGLVATHYAGPTWESNSGSKVVGLRADGCMPDTTAIPWLVLDSVRNEGRGIFAHVSHIQRLNTIGGLKPATPGSSVGDEVRVPYTAEYCFYKGNIE